MLACLALSLAGRELRGTSSPITGITSRSGKGELPCSPSGDLAELLHVAADQVAGMGNVVPSGQGSPTRLTRAGPAARVRGGRRD